MEKTMEMIKRFLGDQEGATMAECALMLALIALVCMAAVTIIGTQANALFREIANNLVRP